MKQQSLIIFTKNLVYGKIKTRLAATIGNDKALNIYQQLIQHTHAITRQLEVDKIVFYSDEIIEKDVWGSEYVKQLQFGNDLGERMRNAFNFVFKKHYSNVIIVGTDCPELDEQIIINAFEILNKFDVAIGPSEDGGYYLLGMKEMHEELFTNIKWSTDSVLQTTIERCKKNNLSYSLLQKLHDVDEEKDLPYMKAIER